MNSKSSVLYTRELQLNESGMLSVIMTQCIYHDFRGILLKFNIIYPTYRRGTIFASSYRFHPDDDDSCVLNTVDYQKFQ